MNLNYAQIKAVFKLGDSSEYDIFFDNNCELGDWLHFMEGEWLEEPWKGVYEEFSPGDSSFWDWKVLHEAEGKGVFWFSDSFGELYAIAIPQPRAELILGLQLICKNEKIQSTWE